MMMMNDDDDSAAATDAEYDDDINTAAAYVCCSVVIIIGFGGNEMANKGLQRSLDAASDIVDTVTIIRNQVFHSSFYKRTFISPLTY